VDDLVASYAYILGLLHFIDVFVDMVQNVPPWTRKDDLKSEL
jgi:hypothetical protein